MEGLLSKGLLLKRKNNKELRGDCLKYSLRSVLKRSVLKRSISNRSIKGLEVTSNVWTALQGNEE